MAHGKIIILNGTSSSGKTCIARALQEMLREPYLHFGSDAFLRMLPEKCLKSRRRFRAELPKVISAMHRSIAASASVGNNVIVDYVLEDPQWLDECVGLLAGFPVLFVGVRCPLEELQRRERQRGDRKRGLAKWQNRRVHAHGVYDVEVDTSLLSPTECAARIRDALKKPPAPSALDRLKKPVQGF